MVPDRNFHQCGRRWQARPWPRGCPRLQRPSGTACQPVVGRPYCEGVPGGCGGPGRMHTPPRIPAWCSWGNTACCPAVHWHGITAPPAAPAMPSAAMCRLAPRGAGPGVYSPNSPHLRSEAVPHDNSNIIKSCLWKCDSDKRERKRKLGE